MLTIILRFLNCMLPIYEVPRWVLCTEAGNMGCGLCYKRQCTLAKCPFKQSYYHPYRVGKVGREVRHRFQSLSQPHDTQVLESPGCIEGDPCRRALHPDVASTPPELVLQWRWRHCRPLALYEYECVGSLPRGVWCVSGSRTLCARVECYEDNIVI